MHLGRILPAVAILITVSATIPPLSIALRANAQAPAECSTSDCSVAPPASSAVRLPDPQFPADAASIYQLKREFVEALQRFVRAQAGHFGDEGPELTRSVSDMESSAARWDAAIESLRMRATRMQSSPDVRLAMAVVLFERLRTADAIAEIEAAVKLDGRRPEIHIVAGLAYRLAGRPADAARALQRAASLDSSNPTVFYAMAQPSVNSPASQAATQAMRGFQRALRARGALARDGAAGGPFERIDLLRQPSGVAPVFAEARYVDGFAKLADGNYVEAVARFKAAAGFDPLVSGAPEVRERRARAASLLRGGQVQAARALLESGIIEPSDDSETHRILGMTCWVGGDIGCAITRLRTAVRLASSDARARLMLADVLLDDGRAAEAERELTETLDRGLVSGRAHDQLGQLYQRQALLPQAAKAFHLANQYGPIVGRDFFFRRLGILLVDQADVEGAVTAYIKRIEVNPNSGEAHRQLGELYFLQGRNDEALLELSTAAWLDPADARAFAAVGQAHVRAGSHAEAVPAFERALTLDARLLQARYGLASSLMRLGKSAEGRKQMAVFERLQAEAAAEGQRAFQLDALRREAARFMIDGSIDQALRVLSDVLRVDEGARTHRDLAAALLRAKRTTEAIEHLELARRLDDTPDVLRLLAEAHAVAGNRQESARLLAEHRSVTERARLARIASISDQ
jgi:tetratricopeptide (TPR) repeat protein